MPYATGALSDFEKGQIAALSDENYPISHIQKHVNRSRTTIQSFAKRRQERGSHHNEPGAGRPPKIDSRDKRRIAREARKDRRQPLHELRNNVVPHVSVKTVKRALSEVGMKKWRAKKRPLLREKDAQARLAWALSHQNWTKEDWEGVVWSDECSVEKTNDPRTIWVIRNLYEKWEKDCIAPFHKGPDVKVMVWACFWGRNKGTFIPLVHHSVNRWIYRELLESCLTPVLQQVHDTIGEIGRAHV